jgi:glycosyltransferase involved in cell wall biosynthesis
MKIAAVCCTYHRPKQLGRLIHCFFKQDYPLAERELVILDDAGQYDNQQGEGWRLVSVDTRYRTLGQKRNAAAELVSPDVEALAVWDDDDTYLPWALRASVAALEKTPWSRPGLVLHERRNGDFWQHQTGGLFHGGWAYTREAFRHVGGYAAMNNGEDQDLAGRLTAAGIMWADPVKLGFPPFYVYHLGGSQGYHLSSMGAKGYEKLGVRPAAKRRLVIGCERDYGQSRILPGVHPRVF